MKKVQCKVCGSTRIKRINDSLCECSVCGRQYTMEEAQQLVAEIAETLSPEEEAQKEAALQSARNYMQAGDTQNALGEYEKVLKAEPENEEALQAVKQIFAADNAQDDNGEAQEGNGQPAENEPEEQPAENADESQGQPVEEAQGAEGGAEAADDNANAANAANDADDANGAKSGEKTKNGKTKKTKEKTKKKKDKDVDKDVDRDVHRDRDIDIDRDRDIDIHRDRDIDIHRDKEIVKEVKVEEKDKKSKKGRTALIIIIVAVVFIIAGIIIGIAVSNSSSSEETPTVVDVSGEDEEATEAGENSSSSGSSSEAGTPSETDEETTAAEGATEGSAAGMSTADFVDYLQNDVGLELFETDREPDTEGSITIYYCGVNIHIEKAKGVEAHDAVLTFNIAERSDTGTVLLVQIVADSADVKTGLDSVNDTVIFPVSSALSTYDLKTYDNEKKKDYEGFRAKLNEAFENSTLDGDTHLIADLLFEFEKTDEDAVSIAVCNMYELAEVYGN